MRPQDGGRCPQCGYVPLYNDAGLLSCVGCNELWDLAPEPASSALEDEADDWDYD